MKSFLLTDGSIYQGEYKEENSEPVPNGTGSLLTAQGDLFEGSFANGKRVKGKILFASGVLFEGTFDDNERLTGRCRITWPDDRKYEGSVSQNKLSGKGRFLNFVGGCPELLFEGVSVDGSFSSDAFDQKNAMSLWLPTYEGPLIAEVRSMFINLVGDLESLILEGPSDENPKISSFTEKYLLAKNDGLSTDPWQSGGLKIPDFLKNLKPITLKYLRLRLLLLRGMVTRVNDIKFVCLIDASENYPEQLCTEGQVVEVRDGSNIVSFVNCSNGLRLVDVIAEPITDEAAAFATIFQNDKKKKK